MIRDVSLDDRYRQETGSVWLSGSQALVRLMLEQARADRAAGLDTAGMVSGYRGSPLGGVDLEMWRASGFLDEAGIRFEPGLNEDLAVNLVWGAQQIDSFGPTRRDGVFGLWYGKNPGLDRSGDVLKHANIFGTSRYGGAIAVSGDDPGASSSAIASQCEQAFISAAMPVIYPASLEDILSFGLRAYALSRYSGLWVGMKLVADTVESSGSIALSSQPVLSAPAFDMPADGVHCRWPDSRWDQDRRLFEVKLPAARAFAAANPFDEIVHLPERRRTGIIAAGKVWQDLAEALRLLGLGPDEFEALGLGLLKAGLVWPIDADGMENFARGFETVLVLEEKRSVIEAQLKDLAYHWPAGERPVIVGKRDRNGGPLIPEIGEADPLMIARVLGALVGNDAPEGLGQRLEYRLAGLDRTGREAPAMAPRLPYFCAGCPHGRSTRLPEGSLAMAGIGCHSMAIWMPGTNTAMLCQMGGEGVNWIGAAPFSELDHVFQNMGDGTYYHSGLLAIRAAVAAKARITYKILVNAAVAMTGGQPVEGAPGPEAIAWQLHAEGVGRIHVLRGQSAGPGAGHLPPGAVEGGRDSLFDAMEDCRRFEGVSAIVYDQICATEKRRHRKRGDRFADEPAVVINERVCEGCGDCSLKSRCIAVRPVETVFGTKRRIDQSQCNTDLSCMDGFCPSFVTVEGGQAESVEPAVVTADHLPEPAVRDTGSDTCDIVIAGVGGTGLITIGALIGMAAHLEGKPVSALDNTGLARKGGDVTTHLRVGPAARGSATRISDGGAELLISGDLAAAGSALPLVGENADAVVLNEALPMLYQALDPDTPLPETELAAALDQQLGGRVIQADAVRLAETVLGDAIYANMILLGIAVQKGLLPVGLEALHRAIELNGNKVAANLSALALGRRIAVEPDAVLDEFEAGSAEEPDMGPEELLRFYSTELAAYQSEALAADYAAIAEAAMAAETKVSGAPGAYADAVIRGLYKLMAYKDEYEVARHLTDPDFIAGLKARHGAEAKISFHLSPSFLNRQGTADGRGMKITAGPLVQGAMRVIKQFRFLRGTAFDPFGWQAERRMERTLVRDYAAMVRRLSGALTAANLETSTALAATADAVRGYGAIKEKAVGEARAEQTRLLASLEEVS